VKVTPTAAGKAIKSYRKRTNMTQLQLAELIDVDERVLRRWESGDVNPSGDNLQKLARIVPIPNPLDAVVSRLIRNSSVATLALTFDKRVHAWSGSQLRAFSAADQDFKVGELCTAIPDEVWRDRLAIAQEGTCDEFLSQYSVTYNGVTFLVSAQVTVVRSGTPIMISTSSCIEIGQVVHIPHTITLPTE
jgi:transcriptional regulator with XRE-family HTH domain